MSEKQTTLTFEIDEKKVALTVCRATARIGMQRYLLASKGNTENETETDEALKILRLVVYPNCIAATTSVEGIEWPMSFETFANEIPEDVIDEWVAAVNKLNPHWVGEGVVDAADDKKKEPGSKKS